jgi:hypothetical protein
MMDMHCEHASVNILYCDIAVCRLVCLANIIFFGRIVSAIYWRRYSLIDNNSNNSKVS